MKTKQIMINVMVTFVITFITAVVVTLLWNLLIEKIGATVDWKTAFIFAIIMGIVIPIVRNTDKKIRP